MPPPRSEPREDSAMRPAKPISPAQVRADFNDPVAVVHYTRAAHKLGLWASEKKMIARCFPERTERLLEAGCGAGRVAVGMWQMGYHHLEAFDFADELVEQARQLAEDRGARVKFFHADATTLSRHPQATAKRFDGVLFMFNGLMQIPLRRRRQKALRELAAVCRKDATLLFTTHDRDSSATEQALWRLEAQRWEKGKQDARLREFGDRYFEEVGTGWTFMHLPDRAEILEDLASCGWTHEFDAMRREIATESPAVRDFSDECRFWVARRR
jgi:SAM-dependent methyltransferase